MPKTSQKTQNNAKKKLLLFSLFLSLETIQKNGISHFHTMLGSKNVTKMPKTDQKWAK